MGKGKQSRHEELQQELTTELKALRGTVREVAEGFILRKQGEIETLLDYLLKMPPARLKAVAGPWLRESRDLKFKPGKGRLKDLKKIDTVLHDLLGYVIEADAEAQKTNVPGKKAVRPAGAKKGVSAEKQAE